jgi:peptidoglycan/LPS O-acetylase OafA/YrhL
LSSTTKKIGEIQGLRALAAILVLIFHAKFLSGGYIGVDIFYVISGFLITGLLINELKGTGSISLKAFYIRRSKRLLPASFLVLFVTAIFAWLVLPPISRGSIGRDLIASTLYVSNYLFAFWQNDYQNLNATPSPFIHYWSLAVEEQFYLFWPLLIIAIAKFKAKRRFLIGFLLIGVLSFALGIWLTEVASIWAFYSLPTRAWELVLGAVIALVPRNATSAFWKSDRVQKPASLLGLLLIGFSVFRFDEATPFPGTAALLPVIGTALLLFTIGSWPNLLKLLATNRISLWLGKISYPLYLWHWPVLVLPIALLGRELSVWERVSALALTVILADLTYRFVEAPIQLKNFSARKVVQGVIVSMAISALMGAALVATTTSAILVDGKRVKLEKIEMRPSSYEDGCHLNYRESLSPECTFGDLASSTKVILYGDSHAAQWFPALAKLANDKKFQLITLTKSACPSIDVVRESVGAFQMSNCASWRSSAIERIATEAPDLLILSSFEHFNPIGDPREVDSWWQAGSLRTYETLKNLAPRIVYILDTPLPEKNIPECLSRMSEDKCLANPNKGLKQVADFKLIDPRPWLCDELCTGVVRGNVAYRDASHISVATSIELSARLWEALRKLGFEI